MVAAARRRAGPALLVSVLTVRLGADTAERAGALGHHEEAPMSTTADPQLPLCFVLMPFGRKSDPAGNTIDFDHIYHAAIAPAVRDAGMEPLRADEEREGGLIHKAMFERLLLCDYAIADLTMANANVFYELGVRHAVRPHTTLMIYSPSAQRLPFDVAPLRALPYDMAATGRALDPDALREGITKRLKDARDPSTDSPLITLLEGYEAPDIKRLKTDVFRDQVRYSEGVKADLRRARGQGVDAVRAVEENLGPVADREAGVAVDLMLSYRDVSSAEDTIRLINGMPKELAGTVLVQEQLGFALNRAGHDDDAVETLERVIKRAGPSSETYGLLGRVHKDRWRRALDAGQDSQAAGFLERAIETYRAGFEHDWRDAYPGINLVTLLRIRNSEDPQLAAVLPVVAYACQRRVDNTPDYFDHATAVELAYLRADRPAATYAAQAAITAEDAEGWKMQTTADNLRLHLRFATTGQDQQLLEDLIAILMPEGDQG